MRGSFAEVYKSTDPKLFDSAEILMAEKLVARAIRYARLVRLGAPDLVKGKELTLLAKSLLPLREALDDRFSMSKDQGEVVFDDIVPGIAFELVSSNLMEALNANKTVEEMERARMGFLSFSLAEDLEDYLKASGLAQIMEDERERKKCPSCGHEMDEPDLGSTVKRRVEGKGVLILEGVPGQVCKNGECKNSGGLMIGEDVQSDIAEILEAVKNGTLALDFSEGVAKTSWIEATETINGLGEEEEG